MMLENACDFVRYILKKNSGLGFGNIAPSVFTKEYSTARLSIGCHVLSELNVKMIMLMDPEEILVISLVSFTITQ